MNARILKSSQEGRRGVAAVEFAIVAPLFFLLVMAGVEISRGLMVQQVLTNASRVGVREAITPNATSSSVHAAADTFASGASVSGVSVTATPSPATARAGDLMSVTVSIDYSRVSWVPAPWFLGETTLTATSVMRREGFE